MAISQRLQSLEKQHQILEQAIQNLRKLSLPDTDDEIRALKVHKLALKDEMVSLQSAHKRLKPETFHRLHLVLLGLVDLGRRDVHFRIRSSSRSGYRNPAPPDYAA